MLTVGIDEVGYGPKLGPLVVAAAGSAGALPRGVAVADSKRLFSQARGVGTLEPAVLGFLPAATFSGLLERLSVRLPGAPWYASTFSLPRLPEAGGLDVACARFVDPEEFNASTRDRNKSDLLFELAADLIVRVRSAFPGPVRFVVGKQGGRTYYLRDLQRVVSPTLTAIEETPRRSAYGMPGATIEFLMHAEDRHELVALASMVGKYVREGAMRLFNEWWAARVDGLRATAGYGLDARRFFREIESALGRHDVSRDAVWRRR